jgi:uncharacterized protein with GYD domain
MIYVILGRFTSETAAEYAANPDDQGKKKSAATREAEIKKIIEDPEYIGGKLQKVVWTLGDYDLVIVYQVSSAEKGAAAALALAHRLGIGTTTLTGFETSALQNVMDDSGHAGY